MLTNFVKENGWKKLRNIYALGLSDVSACSKNAV